MLACVCDRTWTLEFGLQPAKLLRNMLLDSSGKASPSPRLRRVLLGLCGKAATSSRLQDVLLDSSGKAYPPLVCRMCFWVFSPLSVVVPSPSPRLQDVLLTSGSWGSIPRPPPPRLRDVIFEFLVCGRAGGRPLSLLRHLLTRLVTHVRHLLTGLLTDLRRLLARLLTAIGRVALTTCAVSVGSRLFLFRLQDESITEQNRQPVGVSERALHVGK